MEYLKHILLLDDSEYDHRLNVMSSLELFESVEPLLISKILAFDTNYEDAIKYMLFVLKLITKDTTDTKNTKIYLHEICRVIKIFIIENINESYSKILFDNLSSYTNRYYLVILFDSMKLHEWSTFIKELKIPDKHKCEFINIISKTKKVYKRLFNSSIDGKKYEFDINFISYLFNIDNFDINNNDYLISIDNFLDNTVFNKSDYLKIDVRTKFITFLFDIIYKNRFYATTTYFEFNGNKLASFKFMGFVYKIVLQVYNKIDKTKIFDIDQKDFSNTIRKDYKWLETDNFETKVYLTALYSLRICHNGIVLLHNNFKRFQSNNLLTLLIGTNATNFTTEVKATEEIINNNIINSLTINLLEYYINDFLQINNDIVDSVIQYYFDISKINSDYKFSDNTIEYFYKLLATKSDYCNPHYKCDILGLLCSIFGKAQILNNNKLVEAIILYHDEHDMFKIESLEVAHKLYNMSLIILKSIIDTHTNLTEFTNQQLFLKFFYRTNSHVLSFLDDLTRIFESASITNAYYAKLQYIIPVNTIVKNIKLSLEIGNTILEKKLLEPGVFRGEIIMPIITLSTSIIKYFTSGKNPIYTIFEMNFEALDIMKYSLKILHKLITNIEFTELIQPSKLLLLEALPYIKFEEEETFVKLELKEILEQEPSTIKIEEIPEEFIDPLLCIPIKEPIMIPNVELIFDKSSIISQIYHEKINPYTREPLDELILEEHNKSENVKNKISNFMDKYNKWKNK